jgi:GxxExxY protein
MVLLMEDLTGKIIKAFYKVYNHLGYGFLERVYQNAFYLELKQQGFDCKAQHKIEVFYLNYNVGVYFADIIVNDKVILELKAAETLCEAHECQLLNYLKATNIEKGLLFNFGETPEFRRKIFKNENKLHNA